MSKPVTVGWCPRCSCVMDPYPGPGFTRECCGYDGYSWEYAPRWLKRRMWVCDNDCGEWGGPSYWLSKQDLIEHQREEDEWKREHEAFIARQANP